jgi:hypothetical protein
MLAMGAAPRPKKAIIISREAAQYHYPKAEAYSRKKAKTQSNI